MKARLYRKRLHIRDYIIQRKNYTEKRLYGKKLFVKELHEEKLRKRETILYKKKTTKGETIRTKIT